MSSLLIVEDEVTIREMLFELFSDEHTCFQTDTAEEALKILESEPIDLVLTDISMPGMSGLDLQRQLRASNSRIPIVFITSHADDDARARALAAGAVAFLYKPCKKETLLEAIDSALNHKVP